MRYGHLAFYQRSFSWKLGITSFPAAVALGPHHASALMFGGFAYRTARTLGRGFSATALTLAFSVPSLVKTNTGWYGNINPLCIDYALRPRLSSRLTLGGRTLPRKPYPFGDTDSNRIYRYLCPDSHFQPVHRRLPLRLQSCWNASLPPRLRGAHIFGTLFSPDHFRRRFTRWVSYYALFK